MSRRAAIERALCVLIGGCTTQLVLAQDQAVVRPLFVADSPLELTIEGPFRQLSRDGSERPERAGLVRYRGSLNEEGRRLFPDGGHAERSRPIIFAL